ncbi:MAG: hypothetical protein EBT86_01045 [Actinobacteria bacterium]|nr:hypothetical protein [Actinomycetota bacterium]
MPRSHGANRSKTNRRTKKNSAMPPKSYQSTAKGLYQWANSELEHVGRIASVSNPDLQYAYAMSTLNGMAHLKDALYEYITMNNTSHMKDDLRKVHDKVIRVMKHLVKTYNLNVQTIVDFNTRHTLSNLSYLNSASARKTMRNKNGRSSIQGGMCACMAGRRSGGRQFGGDGQETTDFTVQGVPTTKDENSVIVIGNYGPVSAKEFKNVMEDREAGRLD